MTGPRVPLPDLECPAFAALMLAGGTASADLAALGATDRAMIPLLGRPVITYGLTALRRCPEVDAITIVGPDSIAPVAAEVNARCLPEAGAMMANLIAGLTALQEREWVLIAGCDTPLVTAEIISSLLNECARHDADVFYPIVPRDVLERKYPGGKRTWVTLTEGSYTGGNLFLLRPQAILKNQSLFEKILANRKNPAQLAAIFGVGFVAKLLIKNLTIHELEARATTLLKVPVRAIVTPHPEIGIDLDKLEDHAQLTKILTDKESRQTGFFASLPPGVRRPG